APRFAGPLESCRDALLMSVIAALPHAEFIIQARRYHLDGAIIEADPVAGEARSGDPGHCKALILQADEIILGSHGPMASEGPFDACACGPACAAGADGNADRRRACTK